ncbi:MAG: ribosome silencing factor [Crocinitomicaceae bacterium]|nr:ribosome silencing factor [Crocinitomicaceae bacterium]|tara:strand:- start:3008 stop:3385 length:378 start_codon:yes stop_codon:yes gene_type:complete
MKKLSVTPQEAMLDSVIKGLDDVKGHEITVIDLTKVVHSISSYFVIAHGTSHTQVEALARSVEQVCFEALGEKPSSVQGLRNGEWAIVDYFDVVVHVFHEEARSRYALEELWGDAEIRKIETEEV